MKKTSSQDFYNRSGFYIFLGSTVFSSLWACYFLIFKNYIDLGEYERGAPQTQAQTQASEKAEEKPQQKASGLWVSSKELVAQGQKVYSAQCAVCHGVKGLGDGTPGLVPPPRNLVEGKWKQGGSSKDLFITLQKGVEGTSMVPFKHLSKADRWALVHYVRSITNNKVPDDAKELEEFAKKAE